MNRFFKKLAGLRQKRADFRKLAVFCFVVSIGVFLFCSLAHADMVGDIKQGIMEWVTGWFVSLGEFCIKMAIFCLYFFIQLAKYNNYIDVPTVQLGWTMVRDLANMFFVVVLLMISIGTILGLEQYQWNKTLVKLILAAVFINFSNLICGIFIDVAHVFTITFVNAVASTAGGNLIQMFKMDQMYKLIYNKPLPPSGDFGARLLIGAVAAFLFALLSFLTMLAYLVVMIARVVVLWVLIILSPLAFILQVIPQTQSYAKEWWDKFGKQVAVAPVIVFFLWLAFATAGQGNIATDLEGSGGMGLEMAPLTQELGTSITTVQGADDEVATSWSSVTTWENMSNFLIPMAFLFVGIGVVGKMGVVGGGMVSKATDFFKKAATIATGYAAGRWLAGKGFEGGKLLGKGVLMKFPAIGGNSWIRRGKWAQEQGLRVGEKWNKTFGAWTGIQVGAHEKIMKERERAIEQRKGRLSSSAKGWTAFGLKEGGIDKLKSDINKLEGEGEILKARSELKRTKERAVAGKDLMRDKETGELTEIGKSFAERTIDKEKAENEKETVVIQGKIQVLNENKLDEKTGVGRADSYFKSLADNLTKQSVFSGHKKFGIAKVEQKEDMEERRSLEDAQKAALDGQQQYVNEINRFDEATKLAKEREKYVEEQKILGNVAESETAEEEKARLFVMDKGNRNNYDASKKNIEAIKKIISDDKQKAEKKELSFKKGDLNNIAKFEEAEKIVKKRKEHEDEQKKTGGAVVAETPEETAARKYIDQPFRKPSYLASKAVVDGIKKKTLEDIETETQAELAFHKPDVDNIDKFEKERNIFKTRAEKKKAGEVYRDETVDEKSAIKLVNDSTSQKNYQESKEVVAGIKKTALETMVKGGKHSNIAATYYESLNDREDIFSKHEKGILKDQIVQNAIFDEKGIVPVSGVAMNTFEDFAKTYKGMERETLLSAYKFFREKITKLTNDPATRDEYKKSGNAHRENLELKGLQNAIFKVRYLDDGVGNAERLTLDNVGVEVKKFAKEMGLSVDEETEMLKRYTNDLKIKSGRQSGGSGTINWESKIATMTQDSSTKAELKTLLESVKQQVTKVLNQQPLGSSDLSDLDTEIKKFVNSTRNMDLKNEIELKEMLLKANQDSSFASILNAL